ncbi:MAG: hypothetical protein II877_00675 [Synergistaceae bacterium]|nr:hypothetical protein [Synergistaceae bacterium]
MSVHYVKGGNTLGALGSIAGLAGTAAGVPWLSALGLGMNAYGQLRGGGGYTTPGWQNTNNNPLNVIGGLFSGNIASQNPDIKSARGK